MAAEERVRADYQPAAAPEPQLTVVIPHFNQKEFLPRAVASVLHAGADGIGILIVDDGSTDGCEPVLSALEALSPRITIIRGKENRGAAEALNVGLAAVRSRYVTFLGADDLVLPDLYATLMHALDAHQSAALACGQLVTVDAGGALRGIRPLTPPSFRAEYLDRKTVCSRIKRTDHWIASTTAVFRTDLLRAAGGFDATLGVFCDFVVQRMLAFQHGFAYVPGVNAVFRVASSTLSGATRLDETKYVQQLAAARQRLANSIVGQLAPRYPELFARRLRFSAARLQLVWNGPAADPNVVARTAGGSRADVRALTAIRQTVGLGKIGQLMAVAWLTARLRPFSPLHLVAHAIANRFARLHHRRRLQDWICRMDRECAEILSAANSSVHSQRFQCNMRASVDCENGR